MKLHTWLAVLGLVSTEAGATPPRRAATRSALKITEGALAGAEAGPFTVDAPKMRAVLRAETAQDVSLDFTYLGPTAAQLPLGSGALRQQVALKLRAQDGCNLVYATWRFAPRNQVVVQVKRNPGQATSAECGNRGYRNVRPSQSLVPPSPQPGARHVLRAAFDQDRLSVWIDGQRVWWGEVAGDATRLAGPVGVRTDNVRITFSLHAGAP